MCELFGKWMLRQAKEVPPGCFVSYCSSSRLLLLGSPCLVKRNPELLPWNRIPVSSSTSPVSFWKALGFQTPCTQFFFTGSGRVYGVLFTEMHILSLPFNLPAHVYMTLIIEENRMGLKHLVNSEASNMEGFFGGTHHWIAQVCDLRVSSLSNYLFFFCYL